MSPDLSGVVKVLAPAVTFIDDRIWNIRAKFQAIWST